jgi:hypothetical protein
MKNIIYRLKFIIEESKDKTETRNDRLTSILSTMEDIDTETPISAPKLGSIIEVDSEEFIITKINYSFLNEEDKVFYTTIVYLGKKQETKKQTTEDYYEILKKMVDKKGSNKYGGNQWGGNQWYDPSQINGDFFHDDSWWDKLQKK